MLVNLKTQLWFKSLIAALVTGASSTGLSALGIATANGIGVNVPKLDWPQLGIMMLSGAIVGVLSYLKASPVPPDSTGDTTTIKKSDTTGLP